MNKLKLLARVVAIAGSAVLTAALVVLIADFGLPSGPGGQGVVAAGSPADMR